MTGFNTTVQTQWNADNEKILMLMSIEKSLEEAFYKYDYEEIYKLIRAYTRQVDCKFLPTSAKILWDNINKDITPLISKIRAKSASVEEKNEFYNECEQHFLTISRKLKESGVYFREGRNASHAILQR